VAEREHFDRLVERTREALHRDPPEEEDQVEDPTPSEDTVREVQRPAEEDDRRQ
jgi:hypothetical protein